MDAHELPGTPGATPAGDLDARIAAVEKYLAEQKAAPSKPPGFIEFYGGTVVHVRHVGSFRVSPGNPALWVGLAVLVMSVAWIVRRMAGRRRVRG